MANPPDNVARVKRALSVLADNAAADVADTDVREYVVVRIADEVIVDLMGRACGLSLRRCHFGRRDARAGRRHYPRGESKHLDPHRDPADGQRRGVSLGCSTS
jgi:hypothetical protein